MKEIFGIDRVTDTRKLVKGNSISFDKTNFRNNALYEVGKFNNFVTLHFQNNVENYSSFVCIEPFDFSDKMKEYVPLCPILSIAKSKKTLLESIYSKLNRSKKIIFNKNMKMKNGYMMFNCFSIYYSKIKKNVLDTSGIIEVSEGDKRGITLSLSDVESSLKIIKKEGYESFTDYIERNTTNIDVPLAEIDKNSERYKSLKTLFSNNEEMIRKMYMSR